MGFCKFSKFSFLFLITILFVSTADENALLENDRVALLSFMSAVVSDPGNSLEHWNSTNVHVCNWSGVSCNHERDQVVQLDLSDRSLKGTISPSLANLSSLLVLDLSKNFFHGLIPLELGSLFRLKQLSLSWNLLQGNIPSELGFLHQLVYLDLGSNRLDGNIPASLFCNGSYSLQYIDLSNNSLSGEIPLTSKCSLVELRFLLLWSNRLVGRVSQALSNSSKLQWLDMESNKLSGELPSDIIRKMPQLQFLYLSYNDFVSHDGNTNLEPFFASLLNSSNFQELELAGNNLGGQIPPIIGDLSTNLVQIHLDDNLIYGPIPPRISNLVNLTLLNLSSNLLNGSIPHELCRIEKLERVYLSNNSLSGEIPVALGNITHLGLLDLSMNKISGSIPDSFANLPQLRRLLLYGNQLSGTIPSSLGKCVNLEILDLSHNKLSGIIPGGVAGLRSLKLYLNLSSNHLHGPLPLELSKMDMVLAIDLSSNNLLGTIPSQLGDCIALEHLNLSSNALEGELPGSIGQLPYLKELDVGLNRLSGDIPETFQASTTLVAMNFSFNKFHGNISDKGAFSSLTIDSFIGNDGLCGSIKGLPKCRKKHPSRLVIFLPIIASLLVTPILLMFGYPLVTSKSKFGNRLAVVDGEDFEDEENERKELKYPRISYEQLIEATGGFCASSLIGSGSFGHVYKGILGDNMKIAVKVLDTKTAGDISGSFKRECEVLKRTRHRNLIRIITICSKPDFKALVLPLMPNGSLERHLYPSHGIQHGLHLIQLVNICSDVAEGVAYLHHYAPVKVVHCDLKPSNILLDEDMTALVTDFGIARLVRGVDETTSANDSISYSSADGLLCGSVGYIAPEYGMGKRASTQGDVYSFGVLLLEIVSGRRPTDDEAGSSLHEWVKSHYPHKLEPIVTQALARCSPGAMLTSYDKLWRDVILELVELGLMCTQHNPSTRPTMLDVALEMGRLKQYLANPASMFTGEPSSKDVSHLITQ
ncbi:putative leucine-rich repeat receptor-like serine/threonine-protein kinase [Hibiscus syriacus]|uniref:non-specific serine/threonine protein kinase n=1 Tax=Hibiscus syriacus TaxID=106335 RepID=A0A6A3CF16_HIBSY|nr:putative leucine-rich repeat receptor-like serine/threonine-protein kinase At2g24130 [Hibiscus syriacus]KAE8726271.1 putative leucine-rich repeat receptor-like serine/threonine-protein kinase [Hibiscus syriacus]